MNVKKLVLGTCQVAGCVACAVLLPVEMLFDIFGADIDCPHYEYEDRHEAVNERLESCDYYAAHGLFWCFSHACQNFSSLNK